MPDDPLEPGVVLEAVMTDWTPGPARRTLFNLKGVRHETRQVNAPGTTSEWPDLRYRPRSAPLHFRLTSGWRNGSAGSMATVMHRN